MESSQQVSSSEHTQRPLAALGQTTALTGLALYSAFAPHSVAASSIAIGIAGLGWLIRTVGTGKLGLKKSRFDLIIFLSIVWTTASSILSIEPNISLRKLGALWTVFIFYLVRAVVPRNFVIPLVSILSLSAVVGSLYSVFDLIRGRGIVVETITSSSPFNQIALQSGDTIWRIGKTRIYSTAEIDQALKNATPGSPLTIAVISRGEHVEKEIRTPSASESSGITGTTSNHRFRASGWTRHYQTFADLLLIIALLTLGIALAHLRNHGPNRLFGIAITAALILAVGLALTAMRTVMIAAFIAACLIAWRSLRGVAKVAFTFALFFVLAFGAVVVWQTRAQNALMLSDDSSSLRLQIARVGMSRVLIHPVFGHGMDAMKRHWTEWGFPGKDMLHLHSTPLQLAFDRGLPMLALWLWLMIAFWLYISDAERLARDLSDTNVYGLILGALGALTGFLCSSLVNYNYGDAEVAMLFWWLMGIALVLGDSLMDQRA